MRTTHSLTMVCVWWKKGKQKAKKKIAKKKQKQKMQKKLGGGSSPGTPSPPGADIPLPRSSPPGADTPLWTEFLTHAYENITLPQTRFAGGN